MEWINNNLAQFVLVLGLALLAIEILVLGFATFFLFFAGLAAVITSILIWMAIVPAEPMMALLSTAILTALSALVLWKPLKQMQEDREPSVAQSDLIGLRFTLQQAVSPQQSGLYQYSGIQWQLVAKQPIEANTKVKVVKVDVGVFTIEPDLT